MGKLLRKAAGLDLSGLAELLLSSSLGLLLCSHIFEQSLEELCWL